MSLETIRISPNPRRAKDIDAQSNFKQVDLNLNEMRDRLNAWGLEVDPAVAASHTQGTDTALGAQAENLDMNTHKVVGVVDPASAQDAATKQYVDDEIVTLEGKATKFVPLNYTTLFADTTPTLAAWTQVDASGTFPAGTVAFAAMISMRNNGTDTMFRIAHPANLTGDIICTVASEATYYALNAGICRVDANRHFKYRADGDVTWDQLSVTTIGYFIQVDDT